MSLQKLNSDDFYILREKYYSGDVGVSMTDKPVLDKECSKARGITLAEYKKIRNKSMLNLLQIKRDIEKDINKQEENKLSRFILQYSNWFIRDADEKEISLTSDISKAKVFNKSSPFNGSEHFDKRPVK